MGQPRNIAIVGGGPSGSALAAFLAQRGRNVVLFAHGKRPPIIVGESLVPAIVPYIQRLGMEEEVASYSRYKAGATFVLNKSERLSVRFDEVPAAKNTYSYNVPRDRFDASVLEAARRAGAPVIDRAVRFEREGDSDRVRLDPESHAAAREVLGSDPDLIVDAGGRRRLLPSLLGLSRVDGDRRDNALHAHFEGVDVEIEGNVHSDRLEHGWLWRIPLPGRLSMGAVVDPRHLKDLGSTPEEQFDNFLLADPMARDLTHGARRITPVVKYTNYQSVTTRGYGENWALVGDSFGFVDPVFSSGMLVAFQSADWLAEALLDGSADAMKRWEQRVAHNLACWRRVIAWYYDGRLLTLMKVGEYVRQTWLGTLLNPHFMKHISRIFTGESATHPYSLWLTGFMVERGLAENDPELLRIH